MERRFFSAGIIVFRSPYYVRRQTAVVENGGGKIKLCLKYVLQDLRAFFFNYVAIVVLLNQTTPTLWWVLGSKKNPLCVTLPFHSRATAVSFGLLFLRAVTWFWGNINHTNVLDQNFTGFAIKRLKLFDRQTRERGE